MFKSYDTQTKFALPLLCQNITISYLSYFITDLTRKVLGNTKEHVL